MTVNDGKGLYDNQGLCDSLIGDLNNLTKAIVSGQYIQFCSIISNIGQKLVNLKEGIRNDMESMKNKVDELKAMNDRLLNKDGADNGDN